MTNPVSTSAGTVTTSPVTFTRDADIGVIQIDNPPVNAISRPLIQGLWDALAQFESARELRAVVLYCAGTTWIAGADIAAFEDPTFTPASFNAFLARLEAQDRPVVAALHSTVLGGGLELALACHHRVIQNRSRLGLPEVKIGLIPGSLGTQRLPRLIGVEAALDLISSGRMVLSEQAINIGLADELQEGDPCTFGVEATRRLLERGGARRRVSELTVLPAPEAIFTRAREDADRKPGLPHMAALVRCLQAAQRLPFTEGEAVEAEEFAGLVHSPSSRALRHLFFAERAAARIRDLLPDTGLHPISKVGIVGAGAIGTAIAISFADADIRTIVVDVSTEALSGISQAQRAYEARANEGTLMGEPIAERVALIEGASDYEALSECDLVIEAVFENLALKQDVCARIGAVAKPGAIIASSTSTLDLDTLARATGRAPSFVGMHFVSPANETRLIEVVRGTATTPQTLATVMRLARNTGKVPVVSGACHGFIGNRMADVYMREAEFLIMEGAEPAQVDDVMQCFGMAMGPCRMLDMAGVDVSAKAISEYSRQAPRDPSYRALTQKLFSIGRHGQKAEAGYYQYENRSAVPDPTVTRLAEELAFEHGVVRRNKIPRDEIFERLLYPLINEGLKILEEGIASRPGDIDVVWVTGYGFPNYRGGPMWLADTIGLSVIADRMEIYANVLGDTHGYWKPAALLLHLAASSQQLAGWRGN